MPDITVKEGWEARYTRIKENFSISLNVNNLVLNLLTSRAITEEEGVRCQWKIRLIEPLVTRMVLNMIKGTLKYPSDDWPVEVWQDMGMDDKADMVNYGLLFEDYLRKQGVL